ncbi:MAG: Phosphoheptose isomerase [Alphaproteobacteria bacterium MarineAlpha5_Bin2]|jgi:D-sedoheptulose 7-phosphate isomerase|nr:MAG: Phosphoheptose isomerase [Alphaproteobacteria bacterium MarineAlpha5_Bin2]|tara:strand:- start:508 stop:1056 length:549 start_codon:yes stop_codon:yes gene_type:complete
MDYKKYFFHYSDSISELLKKVDTNLINDSVNLIANTKKNKNKIYIVGNGGSSSIASHVSVDFAKVAKVNCSTFNNANLITCFANDYKYENWVVEAIKAYSSKKDLFILISSSGTSKNIVNAAQYCKKNNIDLITLSGFKKNNPLSQSGNINFHVESEDYNFIEMTHHIILVSIVDIFAKKIF